VNHGSSHQCLTKAYHPALANHATFDKAQHHQDKLEVFNSYLAIG
jgi:hypothetical protein